MIDFDGEYLNICGRRSTKCLYTEFRAKVMSGVWSYDKQNVECKNNPPKAPIFRKKHKGYEETVEGDKEAAKKEQEAAAKKREEEEKKKEAKEL